MKKFLFILICCLPGVGVFAQTSGAEQVQALKVKFINDRLGLTTDESAKFWPIYNEYESKRDAIRQQIRDINKQLRDSTKTLSDDEYLKLADQEAQLFQQDAQLLSDRNNALKKVVPGKKVALVYVAEEDFKVYLINWLKQHSGGNK